MTGRVEARRSTQISTQCLHGLQLARWDDDRVTAVWAGRLDWRRRGWRLVDVGAERVVQGAFVDAGQVVDEQDGAGGVLGVATGVSVCHPTR